MGTGFLPAATLNPALFALFVRLDAASRLPNNEYAQGRELMRVHPWLFSSNILADLIIGTSYILFFVGVCLIVRELRRIDAIKTHLWLLTVLRVFILASAGIVLIRITYVWFALYPIALALKIVCAAASLPPAVLLVRRAASVAASVTRFFDLLLTQQRIADDLRKSEELLDRTGRLAGIGGWSLDLITNEVTWSAETHRIHAAPPGFQPTLQDGLKCYPPEVRPQVIAALLTASAGGPGWDLELPFTRLDGQNIWVRVVGEVDMQDGKPVRVVGAFQDITAIVTAREALKMATERVSIATQSGQIGIFDWDIKADLCTADPWMHTLYGMPASDQPGSLAYWAKNMHPEDRPGVVEALEDAIADRRPYDTEFRVVWPDGSIHYIRASAKVTRDEFGTAVRMFGVNWDVTDFRRLTAELAEQHDLLRVTLQSIGDGVITTDVHRNVSWLNPVAERMTGWSTAEATGRPLTEIFNTLNAESRDPAENPVANYPAQGNTVGLARQTLLVARDGTEYGIENQAAPIRDGNGELIGNILVFRDVTEQRRLAAETDRVSKLQIELKTKDEFLSHVSHELRSPLTSIYSFSSIIADGLAGDTNPEQSEYLQIILKNAVQLQSMIEDLLTVTQTREGKLSIELQCVPVAEAVTDALHTLRSAAATKQIHLSASDCSNLQPACADSTRLRQVLIILLDNAIKFTPEEGSVTVTVSERGDGMLLFSVTDTGCGIPEEMSTRVFENLYQITGPAQPDTSQQGRIGLGLGLHIARNLITRQGGYIWVEPAPEQGSIFAFTLPIFLKDGLPASDTRNPNPPRRRRTDFAPPEDRPNADRPNVDHPKLVPAA
jgi:PAS domain S-box-containing protein